jgi:hypothetical protein
MGALPEEGLRSSASGIFPTTDACRSPRTDSRPNFPRKGFKMMRKAIVAFALFGLALYVVVMTGGSTANAKPGDPLSAERQPASLCTADEQVIFSCSLQRSGKIASLCGSKNLDKTTGYIQYRFGLPEKTELEFPSGRSDTRQKFRYAHYFRARVDETEISFDNKGYRYTIFDSYQGDMKPIEMSQGIRVSALLGSDKETELRCRSRAQANYGSLGDILPCDADSPINSDGCQ